MSRKQSSNFFKINKALSNTPTQKITNVVKKSVEKAKYQVTECYNVLRNMWIEPTYTELVITAKAWYKLTAFINLIGDYEISGFGRIQELECEVDGVKRPCVTDFDIIRQEVKAAYVESDEDAVAEFIRKLPLTQIQEWTLDWHSHVNMATSPSGTDWANYEDMLKARMGNQFPSMIVNKKGDVTAQQIISETRHPSIKIMVEQKRLPEEEVLAIYNECKEKVENLCTKAVVYSTTNTSNSVWVGNRNYGWNCSSKEDHDSWAKHKHWWEKEEYGWDDDYADYDYAPSSKGVASKKAAEVQSWEDIEDDFDEETCQYCGGPADKTLSEALGVGICKECMEEYSD